MEDRGIQYHITQYNQNTCEIRMTEAVFIGNEWIYTAFFAYILIMTSD